MTRDPLLALIDALDAADPSPQRAPAAAAAAAAHVPALLGCAGWLPAAAAVAETGGYRRTLLHDDPRGRFSIGCLTWGPGQASPIHDHNGWAVLGVVAGRLVTRSYAAAAGPEPLTITRVDVLAPGGVQAVATADDIHEVRNDDPRDLAISLHVYGCPFAVATRRVYDRPMEAAG
ncbi:cysteine dioxygenase family protein [Caenispirillum bisanense]|uniref:cysteine dioxygenase family protein n=1 Tax=Caenispirillum bisanense TaxID=414052 RepID=UPI0031CFF11A